MRKWLHRPAEVEAVYLGMKPMDIEMMDIQRHLQRTDMINTQELVRQLQAQAKKGKLPVLPPTGGKIPRNKPCPCGSGKKYKFCCGR